MPCSTVARKHSAKTERRTILDETTSIKVYSHSPQEKGWLVVKPLLVRPLIVQVPLLLVRGSILSERAVLL